MFEKFTIYLYYDRYIDIFIIITERIFLFPRPCTITSVWLLYYFPKSFLLFPVLKYNIKDG